MGQVHLIYLSRLTLLKEAETGQKDFQIVLTRLLMLPRLLCHGPSAITPYREKSVNESPHFEFLLGSSRRWREICGSTSVAFRLTEDCCGVGVPPALAGIGCAGIVRQDDDLTEDYRPNIDASEPG